MPEELASAAGRCGSAARASAKRAICRALTGLSGSSEETKWLISKSAPSPPWSSSARTSRFEGGEAEPVHAGVDVQRERALGRKGLPAAKLIFGADHGREVEIDVVALGVGGRLQSVEHINARAIAKRGARPHAFAGVGDEKHPAARGVERRRDALEAEAVAVRP